jgi:pimeloyl-ACP methyl ester carboxylesterase
MALPALVLIHGGVHAADCWDFTVDGIRRGAPDVPVLAVDLPGRRGKPGDLASARIDDWAASMVRDIDEAGLDEVVVVGHSMAGVTMPAAVTKLGAARVREMVFAAAFVPPEGGCMMDTLPGPLGWYGRRTVRDRAVGVMPNALATYAFCNGMTPEQRRFTQARWYPEASSIVTENVDRSAMPADVPRTWLLTLRDRALSVKAQRRCIDALGGVQTLIEIDTSHNLMVTEPARLAEILVERCRLYDR